MKKERMYEVDGKRVRTWNPFVGCSHKCSYCYSPSIYKRFSKCEKCLTFEPHFHPERLAQKFRQNETVFVCSMGDIAFASQEELYAIFTYIKRFPETTFMIQSKNPDFLHHFELKLFDMPGSLYTLPMNFIFGTTIETNRSTKEYSNAPLPYQRFSAMQCRQCLQRSQYVTIEPIMEFDMKVMVQWIKNISPEFVYIGYNSRDSKNKHLPEPSREKTEQLIKALNTFTEVRTKIIRKAWWETI